MRQFGSYLPLVLKGELRGANPSTRGLGWVNLWCTGCYANSSAGQRRLGMTRVHRKRLRAKAGDAMELASGAAATGAATAKRTGGEAPAGMASKQA